jgi:predicted  nucleic acid-binding Zn-ribbon protein
MNKLTWHLLTGACSLLAGVLISGEVKDWGKTLAMGGLMTVPSIYITHLIVDTQANNRLKPLQKKLADTSGAWERSQSQLTNIEITNRQLVTDLEKVRHLLQVCEKSRTQADGVLAILNPQVTQLQQELTTSKQRVIDLEAEVQEWEENFHAYVETEADKQFKVARANEIQKIFDEHDAITGEAMQLFRELQAWGQKIAHGHATKREIITNLASTYNQNLDELGDSVEKERAHYLEQIELLHEKVGRLQHQLNGDFLEPEVNNGFGYAIEGRISNDIAKQVFSDLQIPLAVKGFNVKSDGSTEVGYGYSRSIPPESVVEALRRHSDHLARRLGIYKITAVRKLEIADLIVLTFRREAAIKDDTVKLIAGTPEQFLEYVVSHPLRYRLIADPGSGKTPITAVMVSEILKVGASKGNTGRGKKIPHTLVTVSCPDVESSQKDADYPLEVFLKYGNTTAAVKSFSDADEDWRYRKRDTNYAQNFFQLWVWDELDNTLNNADDPQGTGDKFKNFLKQAHHTGVGWIVSGQSVMTKQIPGFMDDDRELFTQIIIGTSKIRKYLEKYGKKILSAKVVNQLLSNLDDLEPYIEDKNSMVTDAARLLRLALVLDDKSPKLYFLPNLDSAKFDTEKIEYVITEADQMKRQFLVRASGETGSKMVSEAQKACVERNGKMVADPPFLTIGGSDHSSPSNQIPHCPHCGGHDLKAIENGKRYQCKGCTKRFVASKVVWK